jgi:hypothetical protein
MVVKYLKNYALYFFTLHIFNIFVKKWKQTKLKIQDYMKKTSLFIVAAFTMGLAALYQLGISQQTTGQHG